MKALLSHLHDPVASLLFQQVPLSIAVVDRRFGILKANRRFEEQYGPWSGRRCFAVCKHRDARCARCPAVQTLRDGRTRVSKEEQKDREGNARIAVVHYAPFRDAKGRIKGVIEMSTDVTEQVLLEREYRLLFDNVPCYLTVIDRRFRVLRTNRAAHQTFGTRRGIHCHEMFKKRSRPCAHCPAAQAFRDRSTHSSLQVGKDRQGKSTQYMVWASPLESDSRGVATVIEIALDVSELVDLRERLKQVEQAKLEAERLASVGQTVAGLSHGIKNIIMGLEGGMYVVNSGLRRKDDEMVTRGWGMLGNNITRISTVVKEFLGFARGSEPHPALVDPAAIAREIVESYRAVAERSGVSIQARIGRIAAAPLDPEGLHAALANLVSNAIDACLTSDKTRRRVGIAASEGRGVIRYEVADNGCGMDYEVKKKVFTNFFTTKPSGKGTGLGLLETRRIVNQHGGRISFVSRLGQGSRFRIELPRDRLPPIPTTTERRDEA